MLIEIPERVRSELETRARVQESHPRIGEKGRKIDGASTGYAIHLIGEVGEWAVGDALGCLETRQSLDELREPGGDGGVDLRYQGGTLQVRSTSYATGVLLFRGVAEFKAGAAVLVIVHGWEARIAGWITRRRFTEQAQPWKRGADTRNVYVPQSSLEPFKSLVEYRRKKTRRPQGPSGEEKPAAPTSEQLRRICAIFD